MKKDLEWLKEEVQELLLQDKLNGINYFDYKRLKEDIWGKIDQVEQPTPPNSTGLELPVIPEFVAEYIEEWKARGLPLFSAMERSYVENDKVARYLFNVTGEIKANRQNLFARAWLEGYTVEEKMYVVEDKNHTLLCKVDGLNVQEVISTIESTADDLPIDLLVYELTEKEIKDYDERYWAFATPVKGEEE